MTNGRVDLALQLLLVLGDGAGLEIGRCVLSEPAFRKCLGRDPASILGDTALDLLLKLPGELL